MKSIIFLFLLILSTASFSQSNVLHTICKTDINLVAGDNADLDLREAKHVEGRAVEINKEGSYAIQRYQAFSVGIKLLVSNDGLVGSIMSYGVRIGKESKILGSEVLSKRGEIWIQFDPFVVYGDAFTDTSEGFKFYVQCDRGVTLVNEAEVFIYRISTAD